MKKHLFYTFLGIFVATAIVTLLGITKVLIIDDKYLMPLVTALLIELVGAVVAMYKGTNFFDDENKDEGKVFREEIKPKTDSQDNEIDSYAPKPYKILKDLDTKSATPIDMAEFFDRVESVKDRFKEKKKLYKELHESYVSYTGTVYTVNDSDGWVNIVTENSSISFVIIWLPIKQEAEAYSLHKGDVVNTMGIIASEDRSTLSIYSNSFTLKRPYK